MGNSFSEWLIYSILPWNIDKDGSSKYDIYLQEINRIINIPSLSVWLFRRLRTRRHVQIVDEGENILARVATFGAQVDSLRTTKIGDLVVIATLLVALIIKRRSVFFVMDYGILFIGGTPMFSDKD